MLGDVNYNAKNVRDACTQAHRYGVEVRRIFHLLHHRAIENLTSSGPIRVPIRVMEGPEERRGAGEAPQGQHPTPTALRQLGGKPGEPGALPLRGPPRHARRSFAIDAPSEAPERRFPRRVSASRLELFHGRPSPSRGVLLFSETTERLLLFLGENEAGAGLVYGANLLGLVAAGDAPIVGDEPDNYCDYVVPWKRDRRVLQGAVAPVVGEQVNDDRPSPLEIFVRPSLLSEPACSLLKARLY